MFFSHLGTARTDNNEGGRSGETEAEEATTSDDGTRGVDDERLEQEQEPSRSGGAEAEAQADVDAGVDGESDHGSGEGAKDDDEHVDEDEDSSRDGSFSFLPPSEKSGSRSGSFDIPVQHGDASQTPPPPPPPPPPPGDPPPPPPPGSDEGGDETWKSSEDAGGGGSSSNDAGGGSGTTQQQGVRRGGTGTGTRTPPRHRESSGADTVSSYRSVPLADIEADALDLFFLTEPPPPPDGGAPVEVDRSVTPSAVPPAKRRRQQQRDKRRMRPTRPLDARGEVISALMTAAPPASAAAVVSEDDGGDGAADDGPSLPLEPLIPAAPPPLESEMSFDLALPPDQYEVVLRRRGFRRRGRGRSGGSSNATRTTSSGSGSVGGRGRRRSDADDAARVAKTAGATAAPERDDWHLWRSREQQQQQSREQQQQEQHRTGPKQPQHGRQSSSSSASSSQNNNRRRQLFPNHLTSSPVPSDASSVGSGGFQTPPAPTYHPDSKGRGGGDDDAIPSRSNPAFASNHHDVQRWHERSPRRRDDEEEGGDGHHDHREVVGGDGGPRPPAPTDDEHDPYCSGVVGEYYDEDEDTSLGMKLTIIGGHVIVQDLIPLSDGRASPAQLCGSISPGDVLIAIDGTVITGLDIVSLSRALEVLKGGNGVERGVSGGSATTATDESTHTVQGRQHQPPPPPTLSRSRSRPELRLRFASGEGTIPLREERDRVRRRRQRQQQLMIPETDDIFSLSQFVDQLSGMPMFVDAQRPPEMIEEEEEEKKDASSSAPAPVIATINGEKEATSGPKRPPPPELTEPPSKEETVVPPGRKEERVVVVGSRGQVARRSGDKMNNIGVIADYVRRSRRTSALSWYSTFYDVEEGEHDDENDDGDGVRTGRRRHLLRREFVSLPDDFLDGGGGSRMRASEGTTFDRSEQSLDIQTSLSTEERLRRGEKVVEVAVSYYLAVESTENHEDLKRLQKGGRGRTTPIRRKHGGTKDIGSDTSTCSNNEIAIGEFDEESDDFDEWKFNLLRLLDASSLSATEAANAAASATAPTDQQSLLSPPNLPGVVGGGGTGPGLEGFLFGDDVSKILATKSRALPDSSLTNAMFDLALKLRREDGVFGPTRAQVVSSASTRVSAARQRGAFLLDRALPRWLETFKPLRWEHRRLLWPLSTSSDYSVSGTGAGHGPTSEQGSVADDASLSSMSMLSLSKSPQRNRQGLQSIVEEMELNPETRMHTCFLVSLYFSQKLPSMTAQEAHKFIKSYGAYLNLTESLAAAAELFSEDIVDLLLELARYDVRHKRAMKNLASKKSHSVILEQPMLSVLVQCLKVAPLDQNALPLLVSAFPDLKPWQVKKVTALDESHMASSTYYEYLSSLLDPMYGHAAARQDRALVREWCILSAKSDDPNHRANFKAVARGNSQTFFRDLPMLLDLSVSIGDHDLALSLVDEIIFHPTLSEDTHVVKCALDHVRILAREAVENEPFDADLLHRACNDMNNFAISDSEVVRRSINLPKELFEIIQLCGDDERTTKKDLFIDFMASTFPPKQVLETLHLWGPGASSTVGPALCTILSRGAVQGLYNELSGALLRVHRSRGDLTLDDSDDRSLPYSELNGAASPEDATKYSRGQLWSAVLQGSAVIEK